MSNSISAQCGHVKRRLRAGEPLTGKVLEFALSVVEPDAAAAPDDKFAMLMRGIAEKFKAGQPLTDYEHHIVVDMILLHVRLAPSETNPVLNSRS
jgi:hypothetical protein